MRLIDALEDFYLSMEGVKSKRTVQWYRQKLVSLSIALGDCSLEEIELRMLRRWRAELASRDQTHINHPNRAPVDGEMSPLTLHGHVRACRRFFHWCQEEGYLERNIAERLELPPKPKAVRKGIKESARDKIIAAAEGSPRDLDMVLFLADTACRAAGVAGLRMSDLDLIFGVAVVHEKGRGGNKKAREVYFQGRTKRALEEWLAVRPECDCPYVFLGIGKGGTNNKIHGITVSGIYQAMKRLAKKAGVPDDWNPHNWRHGAARGMIKNGASLIEVSQILGHSSVSVTGDIYGILGEDELKESHRAFSWMK
ncbi:MAG: tyrosine-type recombinase/integrase [Anaerolineaceae bacterium]|nr:tyrosine-type recombinase/integrase [Anaerolineaceae bacterium]